jgi:hypothetical protein
MNRDHRCTHATYIGDGFKQFESNTNRGINHFRFGKQKITPNKRKEQSDAETSAK